MVTKPYHNKEVMSLPNTSTQCIQYLINTDIGALDIIEWVLYTMVK